ncbi:MAG: hypothetical protein CL484_07445 [Acidobacteria bacterium]|nr:hypothetical protein [Acidobacteriota bacterium]
MVLHGAATATGARGNVSAAMAVLARAVALTSTYILVTEWTAVQRAAAARGLGWRGVAAAHVVTHLVPVAWWRWRQAPPATAPARAAVAALHLTWYLAWVRPGGGLEATYSGAHGLKWQRVAAVSAAALAWG